MTMVDGPLAGLLARSVVVLDANGTVVYEQLVDEITTEPDYDARWPHSASEAPPAPSAGDTAGRPLGLSESVR